MAESNRVADHGQFFSHYFWGDRALQRAEEFLSEHPVVNRCPFTLHHPLGVQTSKGHIGNFEAQKAYCTVWRVDIQK